MLIHFPLTVMLPPVERPPAATTVHDLYHELFPGMLPRGEVAWRRFAWRRTLRRARLVIAISEAVKTSLVERYELAPSGSAWCTTGSTASGSAPATGRASRSCSIRRTTGRTRTTTG